MNLGAFADNKVELGPVLDFAPDMKRGLLAKTVHEGFYAANFLDGAVSVIDGDNEVTTSTVEVLTSGDIQELSQLSQKGYTPKVGVIDGSLTVELTKKIPLRKREK